MQSPPARRPLTGTDGREAMDHMSAYTSVVLLQGALRVRLTNCDVAQTPPNPHSARLGLPDPNLSLADMRNPRAEKGVVPDSQHQPDHGQRERLWLCHPTRHNRKSERHCWGGASQTFSPQTMSGSRHARPATTTSISEKRSKSTDDVQLPGSQRSTNPSILLVFPSYKTHY